MSDEKGLKRMRKNNSDKKPKYNCENCECSRYSPCGCQKGKKHEQNKM